MINLKVNNNNNNNNKSEYKDSSVKILLNTAK